MQTNRLSSTSAKEVNFASRMGNIPRSFIREMLKTTVSGQKISFAGGLPDASMMPVSQLAEAFDTAVTKYGSKMFQYANSEGFLPLREWIAARYQQQYQLNINAEQILITNGSQQAFDLIGKVFLDKGDKVVIEQPGYLGVIQSLMCFEPELVGVPIDESGMLPQDLSMKINKARPKLMHMVPNFQNPSGISYSRERREIIGELIMGNDMLLVEDDPYGELHFDENIPPPPIKSFVEDQSILLGSFSKTLSPGMRLGWMVADKPLIDKLLIAKQASDLHTNNISQMMAYEFLSQNNYDDHLAKLRNFYKLKRNEMMFAISKSFPKEVKFTNPEGGMFIWCSLPERVSARKLTEIALDASVVIVPGDVFSIDDACANSFRLNFSNASNADIKNGIDILGKAIRYLLSKTKN